MDLKLFREELNKSLDMNQNNCSERGEIKNTQVSIAGGSLIVENEIRLKKKNKTVIHREEFYVEDEELLSWEYDL